MSINIKPKLQTLKVMYLTTVHIGFVLSLALIIAFHNGLTYSLPESEKQVSYNDPQQNAKLSKNREINALFPPYGVK